MIKAKPTDKDSFISPTFFFLQLYLPTLYLALSHGNGNGSEHGISHDGESGDGDSGGDVDGDECDVSEGMVMRVRTLLVIFII